MVISSSRWVSRSFLDEMVVYMIKFVSSTPLFVHGFVAKSTCFLIYFMPFHKRYDYIKCCELTLHAITIIKWVTLVYLYHVNRWDTTKNCRLQSWTLYKSGDCRWISITILCVSFTNSATIGRLEQVQICNRRIDHSVDNITGLKCAKECLILKYKNPCYHLEVWGKIKRSTVLA